MHLYVPGRFAAIDQLLDGRARTVRPGDDLEPPGRGKGRHRVRGRVRNHVRTDSQYGRAPIGSLRHHGPVPMGHLHIRVHFRRPVNLPARRDAGGTVMEYMGTVIPGLVPETAFHHDKRLFEGPVAFTIRHLQPGGNAQPVLRRFQRFREKVLYGGRRGAKEDELEPHVSIDRRQRRIERVGRRYVPAIVVFECHVRSLRLHGAYRGTRPW